MKKIAYLGIFLLIVSSVVAQKGKVYVQLKNGSVLNGKLVESKSEKDIQLQLKENIYVISKEKIDTIVENKYQLYADVVEVPWFFKAEYGILFGGSESEEDEISFFQGTFNYEVYRNIYCGLGVGIEYYQQRSYVPVFANLEYRFRKTKFSPYLFLKAGYIIPAENKKVSSIYDQQESRNLHPKYLDANGGLLISPGIGVSKMFGPNFGMSLSAAYRYHEINYSGKEEYELEQRYNRFSLALGIIFK